MRDGAAPELDDKLEEDMRFKHLAFVFLAVTTACTTNVYEGPERPDREIATIQSTDTFIYKVNRTSVEVVGGNYNTYKVLPGTTMISVSLNKNTGIDRTFSRTAYSVQFEAEAGHAYRTEPVFVKDRWFPVVVDRASGEKVRIISMTPE